MTTSPVTGIMDFVRISERIGTAGQPTVAQLRALGEARYEVVINLRPRADTLPGEQELVEQQGLEYVQIPVEWEAPAIADVEAFFAAMEACSSRRVFVHCARNMRVSAFIYLYRVVKEGEAPDVASAGMLRVWTPNPVWQRLIDEVLSPAHR